MLDCESTHKWTTQALQSEHPPPPSKLSAKRWNDCASLAHNLDSSHIPRKKDLIESPQKISNCKSRTNYHFVSDAPIEDNQSKSSKSKLPSQLFFPHIKIHQKAIIGKKDSVCFICSYFLEDMCVKLIISVAPTESTFAKNIFTAKQHTIDEYQLQDFVVEMLKKTASSYSVLIVCIVYLIKLKNKTQSKPLLAEKIVGTRLFMCNNPMGNSWYRCKVGEDRLFVGKMLLFSALLIATKLLTDKHVSNRTWILTCRFPAAEKRPSLPSGTSESFDVACAVSLLAAFERHLLRAIDYELYVEPKHISHLAETLLKVRFDYEKTTASNA